MSVKWIGCHTTRRRAIHNSAPIPFLHPSVRLMCESIQARLMRLPRRVTMLDPRMATVVCVHFILLSLLRACAKMIPYARGTSGARPCGLFWETCGFFVRSSLFVTVGGQCSKLLSDCREKPLVEASLPFGSNRVSKRLEAMQSYLSIANVSTYWGNQLYHKGQQFN